MNCIFCNKPVGERKIGDHVIPQGLGVFKPDLTIKNVCRSCDVRHGNEFERISMRTGMLSFFRFINSIKSKNNKRRSIHNPQKNIFSSKESKEFKITDNINPSFPVELSRPGEIRSPSKLLLKKDEEILEVFQIPCDTDIRKACNFVEQKINIKYDGTHYELRAPDDIFTHISKELKRRGLKLSDKKLIEPAGTRKELKISSIVTNQHFRFIASIILKAMVFLDYDLNLLKHLIDYVDKDTTGCVIRKDIDKKNSGFNALDQPPINIFYHEFIWNITQTSINMVASIMAHRNVKGIQYNLLVKSGESNQIIIPYGKLVATYKNTGSGEIKIFKGDKLIENI